MGTGLVSLDHEPHYKITDFVSEIAGRRDDAMQQMEPELKKLILALVDQFAALKSNNANLNLRTVRFERTRWINDSGRGVLVFDVSHNGRTLLPTDVRYW